VKTRWAAALVIGQDPQRLLRDRGVIGQGLEGGDDAVPAECRIMYRPGNAGSEDLLITDPAAEDAKITGRTVHDSVEDKAVTVDFRIITQPGI
jgi:hypothetical protein